MRQSHIGRFFIEKSFYFPNKTLNENIFTMYLFLSTEDNNINDVLTVDIIFPCMNNAEFL